jgi:cation transport ATPase
MTHVHEPPVRTRTWPIGDMVSAGCARTLERAVAALPGVNATIANFATATLQVSYDPARLSSGAVATAIRDCGFQCDASMPAAGPGRRRARPRCACPARTGYHRGAPCRRPRRPRR